ncbi:uncharacterized protein G2W53_035039 [Senna tora]|uniref:Uncharacterized protein n=1 Tax=Senna tora TaxID=362788 RepID=A0A834W756_9FABA|nr:uncharacterized protein G2W53_035039 [Senna tora]
MKSLPSLHCVIATLRRLPLPQTVDSIKLVQRSQVESYVSLKSELQPYLRIIEKDQYLQNKIIGPPFFCNYAFTIPSIVHWFCKKKLYHH